MSAPAKVPPSAGVPRALKPFVHVLSLFHPSVRGVLQALVPRLAMMFGPLTRRTIENGAPDGFAGLDRKGPYERLIASEWGVALELPDEFLRRAAMSEHLFLAPQRKEPAGSLRSLVLLDGGPDQLGAPRLVQLAAVVVAAVRAQQAKAELAWSALGTGAPRVFSTIDAPSVAAFLAARRATRVSADMLTHWEEVLGAFEGDVDVTLIGGRALRARFHRSAWTQLARARLLIIAPALDEKAPPEHPSLDVTLVREDMRDRTVRFALPPEEHLVRALRDPLDDTQGMEPLTLDARPFLGMCTAPSARRLFVRTATGIAAVPMLNSPRQHVAPARHLPLAEGDVLVACGIDGKRPIAIVHKSGAYALVTMEQRVPLADPPQKPLVLIEQVRPLLPVPLPMPPEVADLTPVGASTAGLSSPVPRVFVDDQGNAFALHPMYRRLTMLKEPLACPPTQFSGNGRVWLVIGRESEPTERGVDVIRRFDAAWPREVLLGAASAQGTVPGCVAHLVKTGGWRLWHGDKRVELGGITESVLCATWEARIGPALVAARARTLHVIGHAAREKVTFASDVVSAVPDPQRPVVFVGCADGSTWALFLKSLTKAPITRPR